MTQSKRNVKKKTWNYIWLIVCLTLSIIYLIGSNNLAKNFERTWETGLVLGVGLEFSVFMFIFAIINSIKITKNDTK